MDQGMLSLKWENHKKTFVEVLSNIRQKESYCDATIACDNRFYNVHKLVLSTCSEYLSQMFDNVKSFSSNNLHPVIVLHNVKFKYLEALLDYMYQGEVNVLQSDLPGLIKTAECLRIRGLAVPDDEPNQNETSKRVRESDINADAKRQRRVEKQQENKSHPEVFKEKSQKSNERYTESNNSRRHENYILEQELRTTNSQRRSSEAMDSHSGSDSKDLNQNSDINVIKDKPNNITNNSTQDYQSTLVKETAVKKEFPEEFVADNYEVRNYLEKGFNHQSSHASIPHGEKQNNITNNSTQNYQCTLVKEADVKKEFPEEFVADNYGVRDYLETGFEPQSSHASIPHGEISDQSYGISNPDSRVEPHSSHLLLDDQQSQNHMSGIMDSIFMDGQQQMVIPNDINDVQPQTFSDGRVGFVCPFCLKFYRHKHAFQYHYKTHTGEKPYGCPECPKRFIQRSDLNNHLKIHAGEKSFACPQCPRSFNMKNALDKHFRTHVIENYVQ